MGPIGISVRLCAAFLTAAIGGALAQDADKGRTQYMENCAGMVPLGPLKTAHSEVMDHYKTIVDRYDGTVYLNMIVVVLESVTSYNSYINHTPPLPELVHDRGVSREQQRHARQEQRLHYRRSGREQPARAAA